MNDDILSRKKQQRNNDLRPRIAAKHLASEEIGFELIEELEQHYPWRGFYQNCWNFMKGTAKRMEDAQRKALEEAAPQQRNTEDASQQINDAGSTAGDGQSPGKANSQTNGRATLGSGKSYGEDDDIEDYESELSDGVDQEEQAMFGDNPVLLLVWSWLFL